MSLIRRYATGEISLASISIISLSKLAQGRSTLSISFCSEDSPKQVIRILRLLHICSSRTI